MCPSNMSKIKDIRCTRSKIKNAALIIFNLVHSTLYIQVRKYCISLSLVTQLKCNS